MSISITVSPRAYLWRNLEFCKYLEVDLILDRFRLLIKKHNSAKGMVTDDKLQAVKQQQRSQ